MTILSVPVIPEFPWRLLSNSKKQINDSEPGSKLLCDLTEFRLDYNQHCKLPNVSSGVELNRRSILTIRELNEGGVYRLEPQKKIAIYRDCIEKYDCYVDCELSFWKEHQPDLKRQNLILSVHLTAGSSPNKHQVSSVERMVKIEELLKEFEDFDAKYLKIVSNIENYSDLDTISRLIENIGRPVIYQGTGLLGKLSRILYKSLGSCATYYGVAGFKTSPDQLCLKGASYWQPKDITAETLIGGIIGGKQVYSSLGHEYYNTYFQERKINAVYLPFPVKDLESFWAWIRKNPFRWNFYGFSVTMPHKKKVSRFFGGGERPLNFVVSKTKVADQSPSYLDWQAYNTDKIAFQKGLAFMQLLHSEPVCILGTGGTAETVLSILEHPERVFLYGRNRARGECLAALYGCTFVDQGGGFCRTYNLVINCTPIGSNGEDLDDFFPNVRAEKIIDLPYREGDLDTVIIAKAKKNSLRFVDGKTFWKWQADKQKELIEKALRILTSES